MQTQLLLHHLQLMQQYAKPAIYHDVPLATHPGMTAWQLEQSMMNNRTSDQKIGEGENQNNEKNSQKLE